MYTTTPESKMIDIHMRLTPGVDDGAEDMEMALVMMIRARQQGISRIIATPHSEAFDYAWRDPSGQEVWWRCEHGHEWQKSIRERVQGDVCPYCQEKLPVIGVTDFATGCRGLLGYWDYKKNKKNPEEYFPNCTTRVSWMCEQGHSFRAPIREMALRWRCPKCERKRNAPWRK